VGKTKFSLPTTAGFQYERSHQTFVIMSSYQSTSFDIIVASSFSLLFRPRPISLSHNFCGDSDISNRSSLDCARGLTLFPSELGSTGRVFDTSTSQFYIELRRGH
jgi:hypothetical protein